jgi:hypothetical protein
VVTVKELDDAVAGGLPSMAGEVQQIFDDMDKSAVFMTVTQDLLELLADEDKSVSECIDLTISFGLATGLRIALARQK